MKYKCLDDQISLVISILKENNELMDILDYISSLNLNNYYIAAGCVFETIWNRLDNRNLNYNIKDIDVIYYNNDDLSIEKDLEYYNLISDYCNLKGYKYIIDVSNEARMHIWNKEKYGIDMIPYESSEDAIDKWIATVHAVGIKKEDSDIKIYAPYGLSDILTKTIRPIKHKYNSKEIYNKKVNSWKKRFSNLNIINW